VPPALAGTIVSGLATGVPATSLVVPITRGTLHQIALAQGKLAATIVLTSLIATLGGGAVLNYELTPHRQIEHAKSDAFRTVDLLMAGNAADTANLTPVGVLDPTDQSTSADRMAADAVGNVYAVGRTWDQARRPHGIVREKYSGQSEWTTILDLPGVTRVSAVAVDALGNLYVGDDKWNVFKRSAGEATFSTTPVDHQTRATDRIECLTVAANGDVYVAGAISGHWIVRKQAFGAEVFTTIDDFVADESSPVADSNSPGASMALAVTVVQGGASGGVYVVGRGGRFVGTDSRNIAVHRSRWLVRKSIDGGRTWSTVDDFEPGGAAIPGNSEARSVCVDHAGNIYVAGRAETGNLYYAGERKGRSAMQTVGHWVTRKSATGNLNSWVVDDDFLLSTKNQCLRCFGRRRFGREHLRGRWIS